MDWKMQVDDLPCKNICWIITGTTLVLLFTGILTGYVTPPLLLDSFGMNVCPNNEKGVRIVPFCRMFNLDQNNYWYSYSHRLTPVEHLLLVRATPVLKEAGTSSQLVTLKYALELVEVNDQFDQLAMTYSKDYNEVQFHCPAGSKYCSTEHVYLSTTITRGRYMVKLTLLNPAEVRLVMSDISMMMLELNYGANLFITLLKLLMLLGTVTFLGRYIFNKRRQPNKMIAPEKITLALGISCLFINLPTEFISNGITGLGGNILFALSLITFGSIALLFWLKVLEAPINNEQRASKINWIDFGIVASVWGGLVGSSIYFLYEFERNPSFHLETT